MITYRDRDVRKEDKCKGERDIVGYDFINFPH